MNTIIPWLEHLNVLMPPGHIALVGAGNGKGVWAQWLLHQTSKSKVTLIEAEPLQYSTLQRTLDLLGERAQHCEIRNTVVAHQLGMASFFVANSQQESGLLEPRSLVSLWPNLQTQEVRELGAITLDVLLNDLSEVNEQPMGEGHWLFIDCLPAAKLLRATSKLDLVDVIIARVLLGELQSVPAGASLEEVAELLQQNGMVQVAVDATRHPGIGYALFVRDARAALHAQVQTHRSECQKLRLNNEEQAKLLEELLAQVGELTQAKLVVEQQSQEHQVQVELLTQAKAVVDKLLYEQAQQLTQLGKANDEQSKLVQELLEQIEQLIQDKSLMKNQIQEQINLLILAEKNMHINFMQMEKFSKSCDENKKIAQERLIKIGDLQAQIQANQKNIDELAINKNNMKKELVRAEAQLILLKELL